MKKNAIKFILLVLLLANLLAFSQQISKNNKPVYASEIIKKLTGSPNSRSLVNLIFDDDFIKGGDFYFKEIKNNLPEKLNAKYPGIKMYSGVSLDAKDKETVVITVVGDDITGYIIKGNLYKGFFNKGDSDLVSFETNTDEKVICASENKYLDSENKFEISSNTLPSYTYGSRYITFRFAMILSYWQMTELAYTTTAQGLGYVNTKIAALNDVIGKEIAAAYTVIPDEDKIIFLNASDPYPESKYTFDGSVNAVPINQTVLNTYIGNANYDWGIVIHPTESGRGWTNFCPNDKKYAGISANDTSLILHELGHMFGAQHSYHLDKSSIIKAQTYGITGENGGKWFHGEQWEAAAVDMDSWNCGTPGATGNTPPTITSITNSGNYIPKNTPFVLKGTATDPDASASLSYSWEHMNVTSEAEIDNPTPTGRLIWSWPNPSATTNNQYIPTMQSLLDNEEDRYSVLPEASRSIRARFIVRDNQVPYGAGAYQDVNFNVDDTAGPFKINYPNTDKVFIGGQSVTVTWDVANTTNANVNAQNVNILLSTDHGATWTTLASNVSNTGSYAVILPDMTSTQCRIKVEASNNIFFDISDKDFSIYSNSTNDFAFTKYTNSKSVLNETNTDYDFNFTKLGTFSNNVNITYSGVPAGAVLSAITPLTTTTDFTVHLSNANSVAPGKYTITVKLTEVGGSAISKSQTIIFIKKKQGDASPDKSIKTVVTNPSGSLYLGAKAVVNDLRTNNFTMSLWFKSTPNSSGKYNQFNIPGYKDPVLSFASGGDSTPVSPDIATISVDCTGKIGFILKNYNSQMTNEVITRNVWNHLALTVSPTGINLYYNGKLIKSVLMRILPMNLGTDLYVGRGKEWYRGNFGEYDEVKFYDKALSAIEIQESMHRNVNYDDPHLLEYFQFNEPSGNTSTSPTSFNICSILSTTLTTRVVATEPTGDAITVTLPKSNISTSYGSTGVSLQFNSTNATENATVHKINLAPYSPLVSGIDSNYIALHPSNYWEINAYPNDITNNINSATFIVPYDILSSDISTDYKIYTRPQYSDESWTYLSQATSLDSVTNSVTFSNLPQKNQFVIYKSPSVPLETYNSTKEYIKIYPNPVKRGEILHVKGLKGNMIIKLFDISGRLLYEGKVFNNEIMIPHNLSLGSYIVELISNDVTRVKLIIK